MGIGAKLLAVLVLLGALWGFGLLGVNVYVMAQAGALQVILESPGRNAFLIVSGVGVFINICALVLAILVLGSKKRVTAHDAPQSEFGATS